MARNTVPGGQEMSGITGLLGQVVAVENLDDAVANYQALGFALGTRFLRTDLGIDTATFGFENGSHLELVSPANPEAEVSRTIASFLERRGEGLYLTSLAVDDVYRFHDQLVDRGLPVVGPPQPVPPERGMDCDVMWIKPRATASAFVQFLSYRGPRHREEVLTPGIRRLFTQVFAVRDLGAAIESFEDLGLTVWARYTTALWGLDTAVFRLPDGSNIEIVAPVDTSRSAAGTVNAFLETRGQGQYMTVFEAADVSAIFAGFEASGVPNLGPPAPAPPESPWGAVQQLWPHPKATNGAFLELLALP
jgi:catechol 2,3-dioxygenase-like lactoylglutathione lyase family enzyme